MSGISTLGILLVVFSAGIGDVITYEATSFPEKEGWVPNPYCDPGRWITDGWFFQQVESCDGFPPPGGQQESFTSSLDEFIGELQFFVEWRMQTDGDRSEIIGTAPASLVAGGSYGVSYHFTIARDQVRFIQDNRLPIVWIDIDPNVPHTYRLELYGGKLFVWYIDGEPAASGLPEGAMPLDGSVLQWRTKSWYLPNTTQWDYIRYGTIPQPGSGDFDSDGDVDADDLYFFQDCLLGPDGAGPGCRWADMNADGASDGADIPLFVNAMVGP